MESEVTEHQAKQRVRTRWTAPLDKIFADLVVEQIQLGNRPNNVIDKKTWGNICEEFNKRTGLNFNNNQLRKHFDVLRVKYNQIKSALVQNDYMMEETYCGGSDLWEGLEVNPRPEPVKIKECPIYEQLCIIFTDNGADGRYAQSSHYEQVGHKFGATDANAARSTSLKESEAPTPEVQYSKPLEVDGSSDMQGVKVNVVNKRKRTSEVDQDGRQLLQRDQEILESMAEALLDMIAASKLRTFVNTTSNDMFSITNCIKTLDEMKSMDEPLYFAALDLFGDPNSRETFISLEDGDIRLRWLKERCSSTKVR